MLDIYKIPTDPSISAPVRQRILCLVEQNGPDGPYIEFPMNDFNEEEEDESVDDSDSEDELSFTITLPPMKNGQGRDGAGKKAKKLSANKKAAKKK